MLEIQVQDESLQEMLRQVGNRLQDAQPMMSGIKQVLDEETERNFAAQGRPAWMGLKPQTLRARAKANTSGLILNATDHLHRSIQSGASADEAWIGSNLPYAAIHQRGGQAGRGRKATIPARPFLPITATGELQPEASEAVLATAQDFLRTVAGD